MKALCSGLRIAMDMSKSEVKKILEEEICGILYFTEIKKEIPFSMIYQKEQRADLVIERVPAFSWLENADKINFITGGFFYESLIKKGFIETNYEDMFHKKRSVKISVGNN